jgi:hypothetical protein
MRNLSLLALILLWGGIVPMGNAQALPEWLAGEETPKPPEFGIRDESGFFSRDSGVTKRISDKIRKLEEDHGFRIYLMVEPVLIATTAPELAARLQQWWLPTGEGLVVVYESDNRGLGFGRDLAASVDKVDIPGRVPTHELENILLRARETTDSSLAPEAFLEALVGNLTYEFDSYFQKRAAPLPAGRSLRMGLLTIGALTLLALGAIGVGSLVRLPSMAEKRIYRFPVVDRPERLGAPCGGGSVTTRRFRPEVKHH